MSSGLNRRSNASTTRHASPDSQSSDCPLINNLTICSEFKAKDRFANATELSCNAALAAAPELPVGIALSSESGKSSSGPSLLTAEANQCTVANAMNRSHQIWKLLWVPSKVGNFTEHTTIDSFSSDMLLLVLTISFRNMLELNTQKLQTKFGSCGSLLECFTF